MNDMLQPLSINQARQDLHDYYNHIDNDFIDEDDQNSVTDDDGSVHGVNFAETLAHSIPNSMQSSQSFGTSVSTLYNNGGEEIYDSLPNGTHEEIKWDVLRDPPKDDNNNYGNEKLQKMVEKIARLLAFAIVFVIVLTGAVFSIGSVLFMSSQIKVNKITPYCQLPNSNPDKRYEAQSNPQEQAQWIWAIFLTYITPEIFTLGRSYRLNIFKTIKKSETKDLVIVSVFECLHTVGVALLVFVALPELDVIKGAMLTNALCFIPAVLSPFTRMKTGNGDRFYFTVMMDFLAIIAQASGLVVWPYLMRDKLTYGVWAIPVGLLLTSLGWWENYVDSRSTIAFVRCLGEVKNRVRKGRYFIYSIVPWLKMTVFFGCMLLFVWMNNMDKHGWDMFPMLEYLINRHPRTIEVDTINLTAPILADIHLNGVPYLFQAGTGLDLSEGTYTISASTRAALLTWTIQFLCTWGCYVTGKFGCRIRIQSFSYAFPINLTIPVTVTLLITFCSIKQNNVCFMRHMIPSYLYWTCPDDSTANIFTDQYATWIWIAWLLSQTWITIHIWLPKCERLAPTEKLFATPMYNGIFVDQSLAMNRQKFENDMHTSNLLDPEIPTQTETTQQEIYETIGAIKPKMATKSVEQITHIIACATMWHETDEEMLEMFKSILRMDEDQCARRNAQKFMQVVDKDYYEFETQIFFDDAFEVYDHDWDESVVNEFVKSAIVQVNVAAKEVHKCDLYIQPPQKIPTPYGGRLVWTLPGRTTMTIHLKDKNKIRHRKRWSQVMYMYYLLAFRIMGGPGDADFKSNMAHNTFILALDGDIDFKPPAVQLLVDLMKKNKDLGASCGRIHPVGGGMMVWYQKFEYAIGHWLQKATEHVIGSVLCSPGCFSLFRAEALMDDSVMKRYTLTPSEAIHYVQYDQGEDRWLCTLLLQKGWRVEYSAASDAYTHAPEGFGEFYNQRRRWVPSTMANIIDLLQDSSRTVKLNDNISTLYIIYQGMLLVGTILGPGTIFLMMVAATTSAFKVGTMTAFYFNVIPMIIFTIMCFVAKSETQIIAAQVLTCLYALVMLAVMVGVFIQISYSGWTSPTTFLTLLLPITMILAALLHPLEISCLFWGWLYWLIIPSMYMLLMIFSCINMNNISWGTREVQTKKTKEQLKEEQVKLENAKNSQQNMVLNFFGMKDKEMEGGFAISCANLCSFLLCTHPKPKDDQIQLMAIQNVLDKIVSRLELIEKSVDHALPGYNRRRSTLNRVRSKSIQGNRDPLGLVIEEDVNGEISSDDHRDNDESEPRLKREQLINPLWIEDKVFKGRMNQLPRNEIIFFQGLIDTYLFPIDADKDKQAKIAVKLKELRNKVAFSFFMLNSIFIVIVLLLQINKDTLYINWPLGVTSNITWIEDTATVTVAPIYQHVQPIGFVFMIFFALVIIIQFIGMLFHRFETLSHILASTEIDFCTDKKKDMSAGSFIQSNAIQLAREFQSPGNYVNEYPGGTISSRGRGRRNTIHDIEKTKNLKKKELNLDDNFRKRLASIDPMRQSGTPILNHMRRLSMRRQTLQLIADRRNSVIGGEGAVGPRASAQINNHYEEGQGRPSTVYPTHNQEGPRTSIQLNGDSNRRSFGGETVA